MSELQLSDALEKNRENYQTLYSNEEAFLRYPADWVIRFHNMFLKDNISDNALILDYGCGSGNNSMFFLHKGYNVHGVDVAPHFTELVKKNIELHNVCRSAIDNFSVIDPATTKLDFPDSHFDFIISNQVLYYLSSEEQIKKVCNELKRILKPNGYIFLTMVGPRSYYITHHAKQIHNRRVYEITIEDKEHRLNGIHEFILIIRDKEDLCNMFDMFEPITTGYFEEQMFDMSSNFHHIFVGEKIC